jgi:hypothetical protein
MMRRLTQIVAAALIVAAGASAGSQAMAQSSQPDASGGLAQSCFDITHHEGVVALDDRTLLVRVGPAIYRVDLADRCPGLTRPNPRITLAARSGSMVCGRLDYNIQVGENGLPGIPCTVASQRRLTPAEVTALPPHRRP